MGGCYKGLGARGLQGVEASIAPAWYALFALGGRASVGGPFCLGSCVRLPRALVLGKRCSGRLLRWFIAISSPLILRGPLPTYLQWAGVAGSERATVLSFAIPWPIFSERVAGRGQRGLNLLI